MKIIIYFKIRMTDNHVCMYVYICMYIVCMYVCMYIYVCTLYVCTLYVCTYVYMYLCMYVYMYVCMYVYMYVCMYVCMYLYNCISSVNLLRSNVRRHVSREFNSSPDSDDYHHHICLCL